MTYVNKKLRQRILDEIEKTFTYWAIFRNSRTEKAFDSELISRYYEYGILQPNCVFDDLNFIELVYLRKYFISRAVEIKNKLRDIPNESIITDEIATEIEQCNLYLSYIEKIGQRVFQDIEARFYMTE